VTLPLPAPRTWSVGDLATGTVLNTEIRDTVNYLAGSPLFVAKQAVAQSIANGTFTPITFTTEEVDNYAGHSNVTNTSRYTAQLAGWHHVLGIVQWAVNATGRRVGALYVNGTIVRQTEIATVTTASGTSTNIIESALYLNVGDYVEAVGWQSSGAALSTQSGFPQSACFFGVLWISK
jgi:hypothetical protein